MRSRLIDVRVEIDELTGRVRIEAHGFGNGVHRVTEVAGRDFLLGAVDTLVELLARVVRSVVCPYPGARKERRASFRSRIRRWS